MAICFRCAPVTRRPIALEKDVYVTSGARSMARLDRRSGAPLWKVLRGRDVLPNNSEADRFLAANPKFVYAADRVGNLLGPRERQGQYPEFARHARDWVFPVPNEYTDRLFLAANNGVIVCLHDRDYATPFIHRKVDTSGSDPANQPFPRGSDLEIKNQLDRDYIPAEALPGNVVLLRPFLEGLSKQYNFRIVILEATFEQGQENGPVAQADQNSADFKGKRVSARSRLPRLAQAGCDKLIKDRILIFPIIQARQRSP